MNVVVLPKFRQIALSLESDHHFDRILRMFRLRLLPWEYGVRNLLRRPARSALTLGALSTVVLLVFVVELLHRQNNERLQPSWVRFASVIGEQSRTSVSWLQLVAL